MKYIQKKEKQKFNARTLIYKYIKLKRKIWGHALN